MYEKVVLNERLSGGNRALIVRFETSCYGILFDLKYQNWQGGGGE